MRAAASSLLVLVATVGLFAYQQGIITTSAPAPAAPVPGQPATGTPGRLDLGVTTGPLARNWWKPWQTSDLTTVDTFERKAGKHAAIVMWYAD